MKLQDENGNFLLPESTLKDILSYIDDLKHASLVCTTFNKLCCEIEKDKFKLNFNLRLMKRVSIK